MTVGELKKILERYPEDMEVMRTLYSDYLIVEANDFLVIKAVKEAWGIMRSHPTMNTDRKDREKEYLHIGGH
jgi:hypothetical protein